MPTPSAAPRPRKRGPLVDGQSSTGLAQLGCDPTISAAQPTVTRIENPRVGGSIPPPGTVKNK